MFDQRQEILSVTELTATIKKQLESRFPTISVKGEISNLKEQTSGHLYFTLKDQGAQISAVLFRGNAKDLTRLPKNGDQVILRGEISVYAPRGNYQLIARQLEFLGAGELLLQLHALKAKLEKQGWFEKSQKKPLPKFPRTIGVVTSPTGSVIQDILNILSRRLPGFHLILNPVKVQGEGAAKEIAQAIDEFNRYELADVLIVGRGGGSLEDLWAFNEEPVAAAIFRSRIPIISAVGHETDFSIADFVADLRAPTPSAAAEIATAETAHLLQFFTQARNRFKGMLSTSLKHHLRHLENLKRHPYLLNPFSLIEPHAQRLDTLRDDLALGLKRNLQEKQLQLMGLKKQTSALKPSTQIANWKHKLTVLSRSLQTTMSHLKLTQQKRFSAPVFYKQMNQCMVAQIGQKRQKLEQLTAHLRSIDPKNLLKKGYCILFQEKSNSVILSSRDLKEQDQVRLQLHDGQAHLTVNGIES
jgi:exodeoxyribonuclease VII large subunit